MITNNEHSLTRGWERIYLTESNLEQEEPALVREVTYGADGFIDEHQT